MSLHTVSIIWSRQGQAFVDGQYSRAHRWTFDGGIDVQASASPSVVKLPLSVAEAVDPEEAFVASLASCHMLWFLDLASKSGLLVDSYEDDAEGTMGRNDKGKLAMLQIALRPFARFLGHQPSPDVIGDIHHRAHQECFLARSVRCEVLVRPRLEVG